MLAFIELSPCKSNVCLRSSSGDRAWESHSNKAIKNSTRQQDDYKGLQVLRRTLTYSENVGELTGAAIGGGAHDNVGTAPRQQRQPQRSQRR